MYNPTPLKTRAFTLVEVLAVVAVLAIFAGVAVLSINRSVESSQTVKFANDVSVLNRAVKLYIASGGRIDTSWNEAEVVDALKAHANDQMKGRVVGLSSHFVDPRLGIEQSMGTAVRKAVWDATSELFIIEVTADEGIVSFNLEDRNMPSDIAKDGRASNVLYASTSNWVWDYADPEGTSPDGPRELILRTRGTPTDPNGESIDKEGLAPPVFSHAAGAYEFLEFDLPVVLSDPNNPTGSAEIYYRVGDAGYQIYAGGPIPMKPDEILYAYSRSIDPDNYTDSVPALVDYTVKPVELDEPSIAFDYPHLDAVDQPEVTVTISDPNDPRLPRSVRYRLNGGPWQNYDGPFQVSATDFPEGVDVETAVFGESVWATDSPIVEDLVRVKLQPPVYAVSNPDQVLANVTLTNPNPDGSSWVGYQVAELPDGAMGEEQIYSTPLELSGSQYRAGVRLGAVSRAASDRFIDSDPAGVDIELVDPDNWTIAGGASGAFSGAEGGDRLDVDYSANDSFFEWGVGVTPHWLRSSARFEGEEFDRVRPNEIFKVGNIRYVNGTISGGTGATAVELDISLNLGSGGTASFNVPIELVNVPNDTGTEIGDADFLRINYDHQTPTVRLFGKDYNVLLAFRDSTANGYTAVTEFHVFENELAEAEVHAVIVRPHLAEVMLAMMRAGS